LFGCDDDNILEISKYEADNVDSGLDNEAPFRARQASINFQMMIFKFLVENPEECTRY
jgi:hypothetical protein